MTLASLQPFEAWIRSHDDHAPSRLALVSRADAILAGTLAADDGQRRELAARLERWRYQLLHERRRNSPAAELLLARQDRRLVDTIDSAANALAGGARRPPRWPRQALAGAGTVEASQAAAAAVLDDAVPLDHVVHQAAVVTAMAAGGRMLAAQTATRRPLRLYAPLYLSSQCVNDCTYCGFNFAQPIERRHLSPEDVDGQVAILKAHGFRHVLLVAGDFPSRVNIAYLEEILRRLVGAGMRPSVEIAPQSAADYARLVAAGACGVTLYMETYDEQLYARYHARGPKAAYDWRLEGMERAAEAGIGQLGMGVLLGLAPPRADVGELLGHASYLKKRFPGCSIAFSLPRLHEAPPGFSIPHVIDDEMLIRLYCALRIAVPDAELVLSTRETAAFRNRLVPVCIDRVSAGSSTVPGGYRDRAQDGVHAGEQFPVSDDRSPAEVAAWIEDEGMAPCWQWSSEEADEGRRVAVPAASNREA